MTDPEIHVEQFVEAVRNLLLPEQAEAPKRRNSNAGRMHIGGYFDPEDPIAEAFRVLSARSCRTQQDLLAEALELVVDKYNAR
jgi:hypothetical protein